MEVYHLGVAGRCIEPLFDAEETAEGEFHQLFMVDVLDLNQQELRRLYRDHPWVWFDNKDACGAEMLRVTCQWAMRDSDDEEYDPAFDDAFALYSEKCGCDVWIGEAGDVEGFEHLSVTVDKGGRRVILKDFIPFYGSREDPERCDCCHCVRNVEKAPLTKLFNVIK